MYVLPFGFCFHVAYALFKYAHCIFTMLLLVSLFPPVQALSNWVFPYRALFMTQVKQVERSRHANQHSKGGVTSDPDRHRHTKSELLFAACESERFAERLALRVRQEDEAALTLMQRRYQDQRLARKLRDFEVRRQKVVAGTDKRIAASSEQLIAKGVVSAVKVYCPPGVLGKEDFSKMVRADLCTHLREWEVEHDPAGDLKRLRQMVAEVAKEREAGVEARVVASIAAAERELVPLVGDAMLRHIEGCEDVSSASAAGASAAGASAAEDADMEEG